jgi:hypothetical protein
MPSWLVQPALCTYQNLIKTSGCTSQNGVDWREQVKIFVDVKQQRHRLKLHFCYTFLFCALAIGPISVHDVSSTEQSRKRGSIAKMTYFPEACIHLALDRVNTKYCQIILPFEKTIKLQHTVCATELW